MSVLLTQRGGKCPPGPGWNTGTKGFCKLHLGCVSARLHGGENNFLCVALCTTLNWPSCGVRCNLNVLIMCYTIFTIPIEVTVVMQMDKGCLDYIKILLHWTPESLDYVFEPLYYTLTHKGGSVCALFIPCDIIREACIYLKTNWMTKQIQYKTLSSVQTQNPASVPISCLLLCVSFFIWLPSFSLWKRCWLVECLLCHGSNCLWHQRCLLRSKPLYQMAVSSPHPAEIFNTFSMKTGLSAVLGCFQSFYFTNTRKSCPF